MVVYGYALLALLALSADPASATFFRAGCAKSSVIERVDPIVMTNGGIAHHTHFVFGAGNFDSTADFKKLRASSCSTCQIRPDLSAYWVPSLYYRTQDGLFLPVKGGGIATYYFFPDPKNMRAFPDGLRMIVGDFTRRSISTPPTIAEKAIEFACLDYSGQLKKPSTHNLPDYNCPSGLRMDIKFPGCWDGKNLDSPNHKSHMAFTDGDGTNGKCPSTHPVRVPTVFLETIWDVNQFKDMRWISQPFVLSNGDTTGFSAHADFLDGWDKTALTHAIKNCDGFDIAKCFPGQLRADSELNSCNAKRSFPNEAVLGVLNKLPGCHPITSGPAAALTSYPAEACAPTNTRTLSWAYQGCYMDNVNGRALPNGANGKFTPATCNTFCQSQGFLYAGTEYYGQCYCGNQITTSKRPESECNTPCDNNKSLMCGGPDRLTLFKLTASGSSNSNPVTPPPSSNSLPSDVTYLGCYTDSRSARALPSGYVDSNPQSPAKCYAHCASLGFSFSGVEFGGECYCFNSIANSHAVASSGCTMACAGNPSLICGGRDRINVYAKLPAAPSGFRNLGCFVDSSSRLLSTLTMATGATGTSCTAACKAKGAKYAGLQNAKECWCGNTKPSTGALAKISDCSMMCTANTKEACGGAWRLTVFESI
ncbi:WSC-domain-containing protein [Cladochytrium replicatum]|nr:WSC-domain-containing protein [Cladochytrium replicatum]